MPTLTPVQAEKSRNGLVLDARLDEGIRVEIITVTPDMARKWLKRNVTNRPLKRAQISRMVRALKEGRWDHLNGETLIFSDGHQLLDGQHRLEAVVEADLPITTLVVFGIQEARRSTIDTGTMRQLGDHLGLRGHPQCKPLAAALAFLKLWEQGTNLLSPARAVLLFANYDAEAETFLGHHPGLLDSVRRVARLPKLMKPAHAAVLDYLFLRQDPHLAQIWYDTMVSGHLTEPHTSFLALRERLIRDRMDGTPRLLLESFVYTLKAWNAERAGQHLKVFKWGKDEAVPPVR